MSSYLNELCRFYDRLSADPDSGMPPEGMTAEQIGFALVIAPDGSLVRVADLRDSKGRPGRRFVPAAVKRAVNIAPNFLWDNTGYVLGVDGKGKPTRTAKTFAAFRELHEGLLGAAESPHARALLAFLRTWTPEQFATLDEREALLDSNVVFRLDGEEGFLHEAPELKAVWAKALMGSSEKGGAGGPEGICLVTGQPGAIARIHPSIKGVAGAQSSGAALVSFNCPSFTSYGKEQSVNAPVSESAARAYTSALNYLLQRAHRQTVRIGDTSMVFWADRATPLEKAVTDFFGLEAPAAAASGEGAQQDMEQIARIRGILRALRRGESLNQADRELDGGARFFILGLAPNASRLSVRFWLTATLEVLLRHVARWYADLEIERQFPDSEPEFPPMWLLVRALEPQRKAKKRRQEATDTSRDASSTSKKTSEKVPPELAGDMVRCFLTGCRFPENVFAALMQRIHADKRVGYFRAALIKAYLCRNYSKEMEGIPMYALNGETKNIGYRLGRAFALLEKAQQDAAERDLNAPLSERYIGAASATPRVVFPVLLRLNTHHVTKARKGRNAYGVIFKKRMAEILAEVPTLPATLSLADQALFFLGYYHQINDIYRKKDASAQTAETDETPEAGE